MSDAVASPSESTILIVDDTPANLEVLDRLLTMLGYNVRSANSGEQALQSMRSVAPDLVLLDINMPEMDGYQVCHQIKSDKALASIPVIFLSGLTKSADKILGFGAGAVDYIGKPFDMSEIDARVRTHLEIRRLHLMLAQENLRLEKLVQIRTRELVEANARLAVLAHIRDAYLRVISQELCAPLDGLFCAAELLFKDAGSVPNVRQHQKLFEQSGRRTLQALNDALLLSQIEPANPDFARQTTSLAPVLQAAAESVQSLAKTHGIGLPPLPDTTSIQVVGSAALLAKALQTLLETAVLYARKGESLCISQARCPDAVDVIVEAAGRSIAPNNLPGFFDVSAIRTKERDGDTVVIPAVAECILSLFGGSAKVENLTHSTGIRLRVRLHAATSE